MVAPMSEYVRYACPHFQFWGSVKAHLKFLHVTFSQHRETPTYNMAQCACIKFLAERQAHMPDPSSPLCELIDEFDLDTDQISKPVLHNVINATSLLLTYFIRIVIHDASKSWITHVRTQLAKGGGSLFGYISKQDKSFLSVAISSIGGHDFNPATFMTEQEKQWGKHWSPDPQGDQHATVAIMLSQFRKDAINTPHRQTLTPPLFKESLKGYSIRILEVVICGHRRLWKCYLTFPYPASLMH